MKRRRKGEWENEKLVGFRMKPEKFEALQREAWSARKSIANVDQRCVGSEIWLASGTVREKSRRQKMNEGWLVKLRLLEITQHIKSCEVCREGWKAVGVMTVETCSGSCREILISFLKN